MKDKILDIEKSKRPEVFGTKFSARIKYDIVLFPVVLL